MTPSVQVTVGELVFNVTEETALSIVELATLGSLSEKFMTRKHEAEKKVKTERRSSRQDKWAARLSSS